MTTLGWIETAEQRLAQVTDCWLWWCWPSASSQLSAGLQIDGADSAMSPSGAAVGRALGGGGLHDEAGVGDAQVGGDGGGGCGVGDGEADLRRFVCCAAAAAAAQKVAGHNCSWLHLAGNLHCCCCCCLSCS